jgi:hypothetical protein
MVTVLNVTAAFPTLHRNVNMQFPCSGNPHCTTTVMTLHHHFISYCRREVYSQVEENEMGRACSTNGGRGTSIEEEERV